MPGRAVRERPVGQPRARACGQPDRRAQAQRRVLPGPCARHSGGSGSGSSSSGSSGGSGSSTSSNHDTVYCHTHCTCTCAAHAQQCSACTAGAHAHALHMHYRCCGMSPASSTRYITTRTRRRRVRMPSAHTQPTRPRSCPRGAPAGAALPSGPERSGRAAWMLWMGLRRASGACQRLLLISPPLSLHAVPPARAAHGIVTACNRAVTT